MTVKIEKELASNITETVLFYKYKNIRMYKLKANNDHFLTYWVAILLLDEEESLSGKLLANVDIRTLPGWDNSISGFALVKEPQKIIPKLFRKAMKDNCITEDMFVPWNINDEKYMISEV